MAILLEKHFNKRDNELVNRAYRTLMGNLYIDEGYPWSPYRCISPAVGRFNGIWNWDSAFHAIGLSHFDVEISKECILGFLQFQREDGLLPDVIFEDGRIVDTFSKPPFFAWASEIVYKRDGELAFIKEVYPKLVKNIEFWNNKRCSKGLFFYDAENKNDDNYIKRVRFESGWDNSVRWDNGIPEYWAIDLNCYMVMFYRSLSFMADKLGKMNEKEKWDIEAEKLSKLINSVMWNKKNEYYSDVNRFTNENSDVLTPASFMPLYIGIATDEQAEFMNKIAIDKFGNKMPTVSFDNPNYSNDYWRGPTWLNVAYFAAKGLKKYGFEVADKIRENILNMCFEEKNGIFENYDSITGKGLCCDHFSWSCTFILEFIMNWN